MFSLTRDKIDAGALEARLADPGVGAVVTFVGRVRNHNLGRHVVALEYEAFEELAVKEGERIIAEAKELFGVLYIMAVHRVGQLDIGAAAVWVGVASAHRDAAFRACRYVIDELKVRVPIWKKEFYSAQDGAWVTCLQCHHQGGTHELV